MSDIKIGLSELYAIIGQKEILLFNLKKDFAELRQKFDQLAAANIELQNKLAEKATDADSN